VQNILKMYHDTHEEHDVNKIISTRRDQRENFLSNMLNFITLKILDDNEECINWNIIMSLIF
jgi:hypothetical protein